MSNISIFFENLNGFFKDELDLVTDIPCSVHKNEESGEIEEIRIYNPDYEQLIFITKSGVVNFINVSEEKERLEKLALENKTYPPRTRKNVNLTPKKPRKKRTPVAPIPTKSSKTTKSKPAPKTPSKTTRTKNVSRKKSV